MGSKSSLTSFHSLFGFKLSDISSLRSVIALFNRPSDPASLGIMRILFGLLMLIDIPQERGLAYLDVKYGDENTCRFPLFDALRPLPLVWMYIVYLVMVMGAFGMMVGLFYRLSCLMFIIPYWYTFFLDKTVWNNHSYLYGLVGTLLLFCDANRFWSVDGYFSPRKRNSHVPLWNYTLLRFQIFIVYFLAGLKKLDSDWVGGYSMQNLSEHWVFSPFREIFTAKQVDYIVVHLGGLTLDMTVGFFMFFDKTRPYAFIFCGQFHLMNSQIFSIGMFPFTMLATMPLFCYTDWPRNILKKFPVCMHKFLLYNEGIQPSENCLYQKEEIKPDTRPTVLKSTRTPPKTKPATRQKLAVLLSITYMMFQLFLPYSHWLTKGYNNWTNGLYGYSWDMMVHTWSTQHIRLTYVNKDNGEVGYLNPEAWLHGKAQTRWSSHSDMVKQYAYCIQDRLKDYELPNISLYVDVWKSMNKRFQQRMYNPGIDILTAEWHPMKRVTWAMPLLVDLSNWREKLDEIETDLYNASEYTDVVFIADFPGMGLEQFVQPELTNTSITVLEGQVTVKMEKRENISLTKGEKLQLPAGEFHTVVTTSDTPSCYMYIFVNTSEKAFHENVSRFEALKNMTKQNPYDIHVKKNLRKFEEDSNVEKYKSYLLQKSEMLKKTSVPLWEQFQDFLKQKFKTFSRTFKFVVGALKCVFTNTDFKDFLLSAYGTELSFDIGDAAPEQN